MVPAVVAKWKLVSLGTNRASQQLVAEANAEDWDHTQQSVDLTSNINQWLRVSGTVGQKNTIRIHGQHIGRRRRRRHDNHLAKNS
tara:strand:+ start:299 stop:553 length:255 start_codon:yes stop_codon:yes gene_type:complete